MIICFAKTMPNEVLQKQNLQKANNTFFPGMQL